MELSEGCGCRGCPCCSDCSACFGCCFLYFFVVLLCHEIVNWNGLPCSTSHFWTQCTVASPIGPLNHVAVAWRCVFLQDDEGISPSWLVFHGFPLTVTPDLPGASRSCWEPRWHVKARAVFLGAFPNGVKRPLPDSGEQHWRSHASDTWRKKRRGECSTHLNPSGA